MPKEIVNNAEIYYELNGKGEETILLLNGIMMNTSSWYEFVPAYTKDYRLLRVDFRNQGNSQYVEEDFLIDVHAEDLKALLDRLGISKVHLIGVSYGGKVAMIFALQYPDMLQSLVLCNTAARATKHLRAVADAWIEAARLYDGEKFFRVTMPFIYSAQYYEDNWKRLKGMERAYGKLFNEAWFNAYIKLLESTRCYNIVDRLPAIKVPTLCIASELDAITPVSELSLITEQIEKAKLLILKDTGHAACFEKKEEFNDLVLSFIEGIGQVDRVYHLC